MVERIFEIDRRKVAVVRMTTLTIVKGFDGLCNPCFCFRPGRKYCAIDELLFEGSKETLDLRVVSAVRTPTHATANARLSSVLCEFRWPRTENLGRYER